MKMLKLHLNMNVKSICRIMVMMSIAKANYSPHEISNTWVITELIHPMTTTFAKEHCPENGNN
ncbi:hypothetical protein HNV12_24290 [Methanococcoides sp. SA1]|nr:hypothetical protein [Methanococcoides sp. SA1]